MKIANTVARLLAALALALPLAMLASAQDPAAQKPATKAKTHKTGGATHHAKRGAAVTPPSQANPEATAPEAAPATDATKTEMVGKRDPFAPLINDKKDTVHLPLVKRVS